MGLRSSSGRGYGIQRHEKAKARKTKQKHESSIEYAPEAPFPLTPQQAAEETINRLRKLGTQTFAVYPFSEYFQAWLRNVGEVLSEFESNRMISPDDQFFREKQQILSEVEARLDERREIENSRTKLEQDLSENRQNLDHLEKEFSDKTTEVEIREKEETSRLSGVISDAKDELRDVDRMKTGFLRGFSEKAKAHRRAELQQELDSAQRELDQIVNDSGVERKKLKAEYEGKKNPMLERISALEEAIGNQEIDGSLPNRQNACEALAKAVDSLLQRLTSREQSP